MLTTGKVTSDENTLPRGGNRALASLAATDLNSLSRTHTLNCISHSLSLTRFVPGKRKMIKRNHKKSHGLMSFAKIARHVSETWKTVDDETFDYVTEVARLILVRFKEIEVALGGALSKSYRSKAESFRLQSSFTPKVVHHPSEQVAHCPAQSLLRQTTLAKQGLDFVGVDPTSRSLPNMSVSTIQPPAFVEHRIIGTEYNAMAPLPHMGPMQGGNTGLDQLTCSIPFASLKPIQALTYVGDRTIGTGQNTAAPRHNFVRASAVAPPFSSYSRPLLEERFRHSFFSGTPSGPPIEPPSLAPPSPAHPGFGASFGPFDNVVSNSVGSSSEMAVFPRPASYRLAKPLARLDHTSAGAGRPGYSKSSDDDFCKLDSLEAAWAARKK